MEPESERPDPALVALASWRTTLFLGVLTLILGLIVSFHPSGSLNVIAVMLGILMIIAGIFHLVRMFDSAEQHRVWLGVVGLLAIVIGVVLIRHLHLTVAIIGLVVGITWIAQGISWLLASLTGVRREGRGWWILFGLISLIAGIVVVSTPVTSVTALAVLLGIWFVVMGLFEIAGAFALRHVLAKQQRAAVGEPTGSPAAG